MLFKVGYCIDFVSAVVDLLYLSGRLVAEQLAAHVQVPGLDRRHQRYLAVLQRSNEFFVNDTPRRCTLNSKIVVISKEDTVYTVKSG